MNSVYNAVAGAATVAKEAVIGKTEEKERDEKSKEEPVAGKEGQADGGTGPQPYDKGNLPTPLASPTDARSPTNIIASAAAHTDPNPVDPKMASTTTPVIPEAGNEATNADTSGPSVGNAKLVPENKDGEQKVEAPAATAENTITSPEQAEAEIKKDAKEADKDLAAADTEKKPELKTESRTNTNMSEPVSPKTRDFAHDPTPTESPAPSSKIKKRLSVRIKEKLHIGSSYKKDKS